ncbi:hypothetical protein AVEN_197845-1 [Araneus ventricosus]|uniref:Uncharacterized protein n=1 Tax=Araneus ventricosus TaxID=182803 RepID=A0A4Y2QJE7_ARAVE|nr:hypothetical protein AVEN_197845-1 [Araneus ventricosus]
MMWPPSPILVYDTFTLITKLFNPLTSSETVPGGPKSSLYLRLSSFPYALREGYTNGWGSGVNNHPGWESPLHVLSSQRPGFKGLEEKRFLGIKELNHTYSLQGHGHTSIRLRQHCMAFPC